MKLSTMKTLAKANINIQWIVEDLISPGSFTYLVGPAGSGKSMMCIQLCKALQEGKSFLDMKTTKQNCLYIQADAGSAEWRSQVSGIAPESEAWTLYEIENGFLDREEDITRLHNIVWGDYPKDSSLFFNLKGQRMTFVVLDCLTALTDNDLNTKTGMSKVLHSIDRIVTRTFKEPNTGETVLERVHFLLIHHPNTGPVRGTNAGSGYKGFGALCGTMLTLANNILVLEKSKIAPKKELMLDRLSNGGWAVVDDDTSFTSNIAAIPF